MQRLRTALRGRLAAGVVLWAVVMGGVNAVPAPVWPAGFGAGMRAWGLDASTGEGDVTTVRFVVHPLIAELPVRGEGASYRGEFEIPARRVGHAPGIGIGVPGEIVRAALAAPPHGTERARALAVSGAERCRRFCVYRL